MRTSLKPLWSTYDLAMLDLDGVVYVGRAAVPGAVEHLALAASAGLRTAYVTNNASRPPAVVAEHLRGLGVQAAAEDVVTSAQAAARLVADRVPRGASVFVIGGTGLFDALAEHHLVGTQDLDDDPRAVVSGYHPDLRWRTVIDGTLLVQRGLPWVASNTDRTVPTPHGPGPGTGVLVAAISGFSGVDPVVAGKPEPPLMQETQQRIGGHRPLVVGDRLDTDIEGARRAGFHSLLVMTGVTGLVELCDAAPHERPDYVAADLGALGRLQHAPHDEGGSWCNRSWGARVEGGHLTVTRRSSQPDPEPADGPVDPGVVAAEVVDEWWQVVAACAWAHLDATGRSADTSGLQVPLPSSTAGTG